MTGIPWDPWNYRGIPGTTGLAIYKMYVQRETVDPIHGLGLIKYSIIDYKHQIYGAGY